MDPPLRGLTVWAQAGNTQQHGPHKPTTTQAAEPDIDDEEEEDQDADMNDRHVEGGHENEHEHEDEVLGDNEESHDDEMGDVSMDEGQTDEARGMLMDPPGQSGYPADPGDEEEEMCGQTPDEPVDLTVSPEGKAARSEVISVSGGSSDDGSENVGAQSAEPEGSINMQNVQDPTFLAAVKKQSKVKEGDWLQVRRLSNSGDYGVIDIG